MLLKDFDPDNAEIGIHEVYYNADGEPTSYANDPVRICIPADEGEEGLKIQLELISKALTMPVLRMSKLRLSPFNVSKSKK